MYSFLVQSTLQALLYVNPATHLPTLTKGSRTLPYGEKEEQSGKAWSSPMSTKVDTDKGVLG